MFELDQQIVLRGRITTIRSELDGPIRANMTLCKSNDTPNSDRYEVYFSDDRIDNATVTQAWEMSKADFDYLREQGIPSAFGRKLTKRHGYVPQGGPAARSGELAPLLEVEPTFIL